MPIQYIPGQRLHGNSLQNNSKNLKRISPLNQVELAYGGAGNSAYLNNARINSLPSAKAALGQKLQMYAENPEHTPTNNFLVK